MSLTVAAARLLDRAASIPLVVLTSTSGGVYRFSDRVIEVGGNQYNSFLLKSDSINESVSRLDSKAMNADYQFALRNEAVIVNGTAYASLIAAHEAHPLHGATVEIYEVFVDGVDVSPEVLLFKGAAESPQDITPLSLTLRCSSMPEYRSKTFEQTILDEVTHPYARPGEYGKVIPIILGLNPYVQMIRAHWGAFTTLSSAIPLSTSTIYVTDASKFTASGYVAIDQEIISYTSKSGNTLLGLTRQRYGTVTAEHAFGAQVNQYRSSAATGTEYYGIFADHAAHQAYGFYGEYYGQLVRLTGPYHTNVVWAGRTQAWVTFPTMLKVAEVVTIKDGTDVLDTIQISLQGGGGSSHTSTPPSGTLSWTYSEVTGKTMTFPAAPAGTLTGIQIHFTVSAVFGSANTGAGSADRVELRCEGEVVAYVTGFGQVFYPKGSQPAITKTSWVTSAAFTITRVGNWPTASFTASAGYETCGISAVTAVKTGSASKVGIVEVGSQIGTYDLDNIYVECGGMYSDNAAYGTVGSLIYRPDLVMKKWLTSQLGFSLSDIDSTSFDAAGALYPGTFALSVVIDYEADALAVLYRMAYESRSIINYRAGKWYLTYIPDTAPAIKRTVSKNDLAGAGAQFTCGYTSADDVRNVITVRYAKNTGPNADEPWDGTLALESVLTGYRRMKEVIDLSFVRGNSMATSVGGLILKQRKQIFKTLSFPVFWDNTDLDIGDTISPSGMGFWDGIKFYVNSIARVDGVKRATYTAVEWW